MSSDIKAFLETVGVWNVSITLTKGSKIVKNPNLNKWYKVFHLNNSVEMLLILQVQTSVKNLNIKIHVRSRKILIILWEDNSINCLHSVKLSTCLSCLLTAHNHYFQSDF